MQDGLERRGLNESGFLDGVVRVARTGMQLGAKLSSFSIIKRDDH